MPNRLRLTRLLKGIGQLELFKRSGVWPSRISGYERGYFQLSKDEKRKLAKALGISVVKLFPKNEANSRPSRASFSSELPMIQMSTSAKGR